MARKRSGHKNNGKRNKPVLDHNVRRPRYKKTSRQETRSRLKDVTLEELIAEDVLPSVEEVTERELQREGELARPKLTVFSNPAEVKQDIALVNANRYNIKPNQRKTMRNRMMEIVRKRTQDVLTKQGVVSLESAADDLSIKAVTALVRMDALDREEESAATTGPQPPQVVIQNNVNQGNNTADQRRVELARLAVKYGDGTLVVDGKVVPASDILGAVDEVPAAEGAAEPEHRNAANEAAPKAGRVP